MCLCPISRACLRRCEILSQLFSSIIRLQSHDLLLQYNPYSMFDKAFTITNQIIFVEKFGCLLYLKLCRQLFALVYHNCFVAISSNVSSFLPLIYCPSSHHMITLFAFFEFLYHEDLLTSVYPCF